jgi:hypothetical protein
MNANNLPWTIAWTMAQKQGFQSSNRPRNVDDLPCRIVQSSTRAGGWVCVDGHGDGHETSEGRGVSVC